MQTDGGKNSHAYRIRSSALQLSERSEDSLGSPLAIKKIKFQVLKLVFVTRSIFDPFYFSF